MFVFQNPYLYNLTQFYGNHDSNSKCTEEKTGGNSRHKRSDEDGGGHSKHSAISDFAHKADPWLYPHLIEFTLIGATMAIVMFHHIGK